VSSKIGKVLFKSWLHCGAAGIFTMIVLFGVLTLIHDFCGVSAWAADNTAILLTLASATAVAVTDPTHKVGYGFGLGLMACWASAGIGPDLQALVFALFVGMLSLAAIRVTYQIRKWRDVRRVQARFKAFGL
jgi:hypothetical protein